MEASSAPVPVPDQFLDDGKMFKGSKEVAAFECRICKKKKIRYDRTKSHVCDPKSIPSDAQASL